jgi:hypothetical protein
MVCTAEWCVLSFALHAFSLLALPALSHPQAGLLQDYSFDQGGGQWRPWIDASAPHSIPVSLVFNEIIVPTMDTVRLSHLTRLLATHGKHVLVVGPTGVCAWRLHLARLAGGCGAEVRHA